MLLGDFMTIGIICEYNPFHNGHIYHIKKIKEKYPSSTLVLCLNGYFLERGEISIQTKEEKTKMALTFEVDIVIELPFLYGSQSADFFGDAAIFLLNSIGCDKVIFGSETNDVNLLEKLAKKQLENNFIFQNSKVLCYPKRLNKSLQEETKISPNDLLGISYIKAIIRQNSQITYESIQRTNDFHDITSKEKIISASNIREKMKNNEDITPYLPKISKENIKKLDERKIFTFLKYKIITEPNLAQYLDVTEGLDFKLKKEIIKVNSYEELVLALTSKRYTKTRIQRMLIHILIGVLKSDAKIPLNYITILGFSKKGQNYLKENRKKITLPLHKNFKSKIYEYEQKASILYDMLLNENTQTFEKRNQPITTCSKESIQK